ncbi:MMPL family transporter [Pararhodospirillum oryzae]|uniref:SSD domain-containing protein n=1 Tax=Pararhodospirillum oryzae TaxID=478448 RepID=A0A512H5I6_9PROT|nr:MMPL family transporter [Pararhodospirillum oryzae]GEO80736.1 hypothetical protein ROR02_08670 [Pararhodospirillum oryzae]
MKPSAGVVPPVSGSVEPAPVPPSPAGPSSRLERALVRACVAWIGAVMRRPRLVLAGLVVVMALSGGAIATHLGIRTDTSAMLSPDLPFQQDLARYKAAFPTQGDEILVVLDSLDPNRIDTAAQDLVAALAGRPDVIASVQDVAGLPFFRQNGLLYLPLDRLEALSDSLIRAQPLLGGLWHDPSLRGLADALDLALGPQAQAAGMAPPQMLAPVLDRLADVVPTAAQAQGPGLDWSSVLAVRGNTAGTPGRRLIVVRPVLDHGSLSPAGQAMAAVREAARAQGLTPEAGFRVRLTGGAALAQEELGTVRSSMGLANLVSLGVVALLLVIGLRSGVLIGATLSALLAGLVLTAGFAAVAVGTLNLISVAFAVLFIGLSVDFGLHYGLRYRELVAAGTANAQALIEAARGTGPSLVLSALAATLAFLAFLPTDYLGLAQLGLISGAGMGIALLLNLSVLPAFLTLWPARVRPLGAGPLVGLGRVPERHPRVVLGITAVLAGLAVGVALHLRFDADPLNLKDPATESVSTLFDVMAEPGVDPYAVNVLAADPAEARRLGEALRALPEVKGVASLPALIPADQDDKQDVIADLAAVLGPTLAGPRGPAPDGDALAQARARLIALLTQTSARADAGAVGVAAGRLAQALAAQPDDPATLARLDQGLMGGLVPVLARLRDGLDARPVGLDDVPAVLRQRYEGEGGVLRLEVFPAADLRDAKARAAFVDAVRGVAPHATGAPITIVEAAATMLSAFTEAAVIALVLVSAMLLAMVPRLKALVLVFAPVLLAGVLTGAAAELLGQALNLANVIVLPLLVGLGVAGAIHVVGRAREAGAMTQVLESSTPRAVVFSALTTVASFGSLALSAHPGTASMGVLLTLALSFSLVCTLGVLPAVMVAWPDRPRARRRET